MPEAHEQPFPLYRLNTLAALVVIAAILISSVFARAACAVLAARGRFLHNDRHVRACAKLEASAICCNSRCGRGAH
jgi:hypothetical protein